MTTLEPLNLAVPCKSWWPRREASLNWIAFGLLLAAWNASDNDATPAARRPQALRVYQTVSVRAAARAHADGCH
jgi:hypothetical protein